MALVTHQEAPPLVSDDHGVTRVGGTRVTLDSVVHAFQQGATPEEIVFRYPVLDLADVYATLAYYLRHREDVDVYLLQREAAGDDSRREAEAFFDTSALRERLLQRRRER